MCISSDSLRCSHSIYGYDHPLTITTSLGVRVIACTCGVGLRPLAAASAYPTDHRQPDETLEEVAERVAAAEVLARLPRDYDRARGEYYTVPSPERRAEIAERLCEAPAPPAICSPRRVAGGWCWICSGAGKSTPQPWTRCAAVPCSRRLWPSSLPGSIAVRPALWPRRLAGRYRTSKPSASRFAAGMPRPPQPERRTANARLLAGRIGREALEKMLPSLLEQVSHEADAAVRAAVIAVGRIGDQAANDLSRMRTGEDFSGKKGRHHKLERTTLCRVEHLADWSACLLTLRDYVSFGSSSWGNGDRNYGSRGGSSFRVFLVVRDSTTGEAHILRVPPKFGNSDTQFFGKFSNARERIQAAVAWTFSREAGEYAPTHQA